MAENHHGSFEEGSGMLPDLRTGNLWMKRPFREGIGSSGMGNGCSGRQRRDREFHILQNSVCLLIYCCSVVRARTHFLMSRVDFRKKVCSHLTRRRGLWFLTQQNSCLTRHWLTRTAPILLQPSNLPCCPSVSFLRRGAAFSCCVSPTPLPLSPGLLACLQTVETILLCFCDNEHCL